VVSYSGQIWIVLYEQSVLGILYCYTDDLVINFLHSSPGAVTAAYTGISEGTREGKGWS
jgi:hypothetical protein